MVKCLGIFRELQNSPNRETDDALILKAVMSELENLKVDVEIWEPEALDARDLGGFDMIVPMCESYPRLMRLKSVKEKSNALVINPPDAVLSCYRTRMLDAFAASPLLRLPPTEVHSVTAPGPLPQPFFGEDSGFWIKRGDVHNTCSRDVVFARTLSDAEAVRRDFARREIAFLLVQKHIDGDLIKFYGVGPGQWFTWFYHDPQSARRLPFELESLAAQAQAAALAVGVEIFGGDAIVSPDGSVYIIDINSWPSFARVRPEAAIQIARLLRARLGQAERGRQLR